MIPPSDATSAFILIRITTQKFGTTHLIFNLFTFNFLKSYKIFLSKNKIK